MKCLAFRRLILGGVLLMSVLGDGSRAKRAQGAEGPAGGAEGIVTRIAANRKLGSSDAVAVTKRVLAHTNQIFPLDASGGLVVGETNEQIRATFENLTKSLKPAGATLDDVVKLNLYVTEPDVVPLIQKELATRFAQSLPAVTWVTTRLPHRGAQLAVDAVAVATHSEPKVRRFEHGRSNGARGPVAVATLPVGPRVYISGQAEKGDGSLADATRKTLESLQESLQFAGQELTDVIQLKAFLTPMSEVAEVEKEVQKFFAGQPAPPLVCVEWTSTLPIEIELIAAGSPNGRGTPDGVEYLAPPKLKHSPVYSRIARVDSPTTIYVAGLFAGGEKSAEQEVRELLLNLANITESAGSDLRHLVKATYYVTEDGGSNGLNKIRPEFYDPARPPTASKAMVRGVGLTGHRLTLDMIAVPRK